MKSSGESRRHYITPTACAEQFPRLSSVTGRAYNAAMQRLRTAIAVLLLVLSALSADAAGLSAADRAWITRCVAQHAHADRKVVRIYCTCMHDYFEDNAMVTQTEMERMFPPAHSLCHAKAGWK